MPIRTNCEINLLIIRLLDAEFIILYCFPKNMAPGWAIIEKKKQINFELLCFKISR